MNKTFKQEMIEAALKSERTHRMKKDSPVIVFDAANGEAVTGTIWFPKLDGESEAEFVSRFAAAENGEVLFV